MAMSRLEGTRGAEPPPLLVFAALREELAPLRRRGHLGLELIRTGVGVANADRTVRWRLQQAKVRTVLGIGFAGGLSPSLQVGDLLVARQIRGNSTSEPSRELLQAAESVCTDRLGLHFGIATTVSDFVCKASSKQALARAVGNEQVACVDMESAAVAHACSEHGIPFLIVRCISDRLDEDLPLDFNRCRKADGNISPAKVAWAALLHPQALGPLQELQKRSRACAEKLAQFVEELIPWIRL